jgi:hypothetical protein
MMGDCASREYGRRSLDAGLRALASRTSSRMGIFTKGDYQKANGTSSGTTRNRREIRSW